MKTFYFLYLSLYMFMIRIHFLSYLRLFTFKKETHFFHISNFICSWIESISYLTFTLYVQKWNPFPFLSLPLYVHELNPFPFLSLTLYLHEWNPFSSFIYLNIFINVIHLLSYLHLYMFMNGIYLISVYPTFVVCTLMNGIHFLSLVVPCFIHVFLLFTFPHPWMESINSNIHFLSLP